MRLAPVFQLSTSAFQLPARRRPSGFQLSTRDSQLPAPGAGIVMDNGRQLPEP